MKSIDISELDDDIPNDKELKQVLDWTIRARISGVSVNPLMMGYGTHDLVDGKSYFQIDTPLSMKDAHHFEFKPESILFQIHLREHIHAGVSQFGPRHTHTDEERKVRDWTNKLMNLAWGSYPG
ncbi:MAG: hypothetical protein OXG24_07415 [Gammaproteobacteria bacterium]|nr:hypothetical protein [Gammaproteobacteria bacterium]